MAARMTVRTNERAARVVSAPVAAETLVPEPEPVANEPGERTESAAGRLLAAAVVWGAVVLGGEAIGEPWRTPGLLDGGIERQVLAATAALGALVLLVGFAQELAAVWTGDVGARRVAGRLLLVMLAAAVVGGSTWAASAGLGDRVAFAAVRPDFDRAARQVRADGATSVSVGGERFEVEIERGLVRFVAADDGVWNAPDLVRVEWGGAPAGAANLGGGWYSVR